MTAVALPNVGITAGLLPGEDGWSDLMNKNLRLVDALMQGVIADKDLAAPPGSPTAGVAYIVAASPTGAWASQAGKIAIWQAGDDLTSAWLFVTPKEGWRMWVADEDKDYRFDGTAWNAVASGGSSSIPPVVTNSTTALTATAANAGNYTRFTNAAAKAYSFDSAQTYSVDAEYHARNVGAGDLTLTQVGSFVLRAPADGTLVVPQGGTVTIKIVGAAEADVLGVTVPA